MTRGLRQVLEGEALELTLGTLAVPNREIVNPGHRVAVLLLHGNERAGQGQPMNLAGFAVGAAVNRAARLEPPIRSAHFDVRRLSSRW